MAELLISYDGAPPLYTVNLLELNADNKIAHERVYIMEGWKAPELPELDRDQWAFLLRLAGPSG